MPNLANISEEAEVDLNLVPSFIAANPPILFAYNGSTNHGNGVTPRYGERLPGAGSQPRNERGIVDADITYDIDKGYFAGRGDFLWTVLPERSTNNFNAQMKWSYQQTGSANNRYASHYAELQIVTGDQVRFAVNTGGGGFINHTSWNYTSDDRLKVNEELIENGLETINQLEPVNYYRTQEFHEADKTFSEEVLKNLDASYESGFIAQNVQDIPQLSHLVNGEEVDSNGVKTPLTIKYNFFFPFLVKAIQELSAKNDALEARLAALEANQS